ncbi:polypeptide N-acetylgalactosaminyltransferase 5-like [Haliotis rubra]|uniref:polypeptide N-acetylgalactosaminyltransferase 5-like n=1 Tax=Haliotis rubra TaxID=36100 RepID=UPI001EE62661|nr:polypeptide N-acetylgalactosaminyltransferase 5-like [Haliotis rubra]
MRLHTFVRYILLVCCFWLAVVFVTFINTLGRYDEARGSQQDQVPLEEAMAQLLARNRTLLMRAVELAGLGEFHDDRGIPHHNHPPNDPRNDPNSRGYGGKGVVIDPQHLSPMEKALYDRGYQDHNFNEFASDLIPLRRRLINITEPECLARHYDYSKLPTAGVVVIFHNEAWSPLLRTVHSILDNTAPELLTEIVLVDDASDKVHLGHPLSDYIQQLDNVRLVRYTERVGLMTARNAGCDEVTGEVCAFLDAHCEVPEMWLEPLLDRIRQNDKLLAIPTTDSISSDTFEYWKSNPKMMYKGGVDLDLYFSWIPLTKAEEERDNVLDPVRSPTHLGCCFAMSKANFNRLGKYDPGLKIWGCENQELSFKTWMCGGEMEIIPCSHVGHMFRNMPPWSWGKGGDTDRLHKNCLRVSEVWMDEYKTLHHERIYNRQLDFGDVSDRKALRKSLQCRSFDWYVKNVYPELYIFTGGSAIGRISNMAVPERCVQTPIHHMDFGRHVATDICSHYSLIQHFTLTKEATIRRDDGCLDFDNMQGLIVTSCTDAQGWQYTAEDTLLHGKSGRCLELAPDDVTLLVSICSGSSRQRWSWERRPAELGPREDEVPNRDEQ